MSTPGIDDGSTIDVRYLWEAMGPEAKAWLAERARATYGLGVLEAVRLLGTLAHHEAFAGRCSHVPTGELRRAVWWSRTWSLAYAWRRGFGMFGESGNRKRAGRTVLRSNRISLSGVQSWRVHKHEKQAWARLEELAQ